MRVERLVTRRDEPGFPEHVDPVDRLGHLDSHRLDHARVRPLVVREAGEQHHVAVELVQDVARQQLVVTRERIAEAARLARRLFLRQVPATRHEAGAVEPLLQSALELLEAGEAPQLYGIPTLSRPSGCQPVSSIASSAVSTRTPSGASPWSMFFSLPTHVKLA
jgi:hypothetical protein